MRKGHFITFEGMEGMGKSTLIQSISQSLQKRGISVLLTREPGGSPAAEAIRELILHHSTPLDPTAELLLLFAARAEHLAHTIRPALAEGKWVLCDRFTDSTYAYQGGGRKLPNKMIHQLEQWVQEGLNPDLTFLLDASPDLGLQRIKKREKDRIEQESADFFDRVRQAYLDRVSEDKTHRFVVLNAARSPRIVQQEALQAIERLVE